VPGFEKYYPDVERINPKYFQNMDEKIDYLNSQGFVPFIEVSRRDIGQCWKKFYDWPGSYTRYIQYIWSRYQANICLFSPIHLDWTGATIPAATLRNFGHTDKARWLTFHQIGNRRTHDLYPYLTEIFNASPPVPGINGEPYYAGMLDAEGGTDKSALYCRSAMYGSVLSGGLGGHIYGAGGWQGGLWSGEVEDASPTPIWEVIKWESAGQMRHLRDFVLSEGRKYQELVPSAGLVEPGRTGKGKSCVGWAYCARTAEKDFFLLYFEKDCPAAKVSGAAANGKYEAKWFGPRKGQWIDAGVLTAGDDGVITLPKFPPNKGRSDVDWAMKLKLAKR